MELILRSCINSVFVGKISQSKQRVPYTYACIEATRPTQISAHMQLSPMEIAHETHNKHVCIWKLKKQ